MSKCLYCYKNIKEPHDLDQEYHTACVETFFGTKVAPVLPYKMDDMAELAKQIIQRSVSVPGVQPKLSMGIINDVLEDKTKGRMTILDALNGLYILKPQNKNYPFMPENEHLSMRLAELFGIDVVPSTLIRLESNELCYLTKRIDRTDENKKIHMIDFLQILELEDKYMGTMEQLGKKIGELSEYVLLDKLRFFELALFNFVIVNNDMHLKNFSMILSDNGWMLSPAYDLLNVKIILPSDKDETALLLGGKKKNHSRSYFERFGDQLELNNKQIQSVFKRIEKWMPKAQLLINKSFLPKDLKLEYIEVISTQVAKLEA